MERQLRSKALVLLLSLIYLGGFCLFYYKYVPLIPSFQLVLLPILIILFILTTVSIESGILFFIFTFPLINNLPYFFGVYENIPHAPTALVFFLIFFLGWLLNHLFSSSRLRMNTPLSKPIIIISAIIIISSLITIFRYANFYPFLSSHIHELNVNILEVRAGGAIMSTVFNSLNYLSGFFFFLILVNHIKSKELLRKIFIVLASSALISLLFSLVQKYHSLPLGNTPYWVNSLQMNSTFKDPNSFGIYLSALLPLFFGLLFYFRKYLRVFVLCLILLALLVFPSISPRSGFLGLLISLLSFSLLFLVGFKISQKKKAFFASTTILIVLLIFLSFFMFSKQSSLYQRLDWSLNTLNSENFLKELFTGKLNLWSAACLMMKEYPLTGVGMGSFIIELPNHLRTLKLPYMATDSAENYFLQIGSELGIVALLLAFWIFFEIMKQMRRRLRELPTDKEERFMIMGVIAGLISLSVNFLFHSLIGSYELKYFFWLLVALLFVYPKMEQEYKTQRKITKKFRITVLIVAFLFGAVHLWNSSHSLSIKNETARFGWKQNFGFYSSEKDHRNYAFRWTRKSAGIAVKNLGPKVVIPIKASHPDIDKYPVKIKIFEANHYFKKKKSVQEITLDNTEWIDFEYSIPDLPETRTHFVFETNRTWVPKNYLRVEDPRSLAISVGEVWYKYPTKIAKSRIKTVEKLPAKKWRGKHGENLVVNGKSRIKFDIKNENAALRLWVKGTKALGVGPYITIRLNYNLIGKTYLPEEGWTSLILSPQIGRGHHHLSIEFTNDFSEPKSDQDRDVFLGDFEILYLR